MPDDRYPPGAARGASGAEGVARRDAAVLLARAAREYGDVAAITLGRQPAVLLSHPDDIEDVLVRRARSFRVGTPLEHAKGILDEGLLTSEGDAHLRRRRLLQPSFHRRCITGLTGAILRRTRRLSAAWWDRRTVDMVEEMSRLTLGVAGEALFSVDLDTESADLVAALGDAMVLYNATVWTTETRERVERVRARLDALVYGLIARRRPSGGARNDVLSALLAAGLSDTELRDELVTLLFAGHETVANALAWTWYLLAEHPAVECRLHAELAAALPRGPSGYADPDRLPYARAVLAESMRLYPPGWVIGRTAVDEYAVRGYTLPAGTVVLVSQWVTHRDARWFPEPERFDPDRWLRRDTPGRPRYAYFPEAAGEDARLASERLRSHGAGHAFRLPSGMAARVTLSVGLATYPTDGASRRELLRAADAALYAAKRSGRDRVCVASAEAHGESTLRAVGAMPPTAAPVGAPG